MSGIFGKTTGNGKWHAWGLLLSGLAAAVVCISCASGPKAPEPGTPGFFWGSAKESFKAGDITRTDEQLQKILAGDNEFTVRARAWDMVLSAGLAKGYSEMADAYEAGARMNRANPTPFRKAVSTLRSNASAASLQMADEVHQFLAKDKDANVVLAFGYPAGNFAQPGSLKKVAGGILVQDSERDLLQTAMLQRGVMQATGEALDSPDDAAKAADKMKTGEAQVSRDAFLWAAAKQLEQMSQLYTPTKLDLPNRFMLLSDGSLEVLKAIPATKDTKALAEKIQKATDKLKKHGGV